MEDNRVFWIWMQLVFGIATRRTELMMSYFEHPQTIYEGIAAGGRVAGMLEPEELASSERAMERAREILRRTLHKGCDIVTPDHPAYPPLLHSLYDRPAALYVKGDLTCMRERLAIAMVGTRKHTEYGQRAGALLAADLAKGGAVIVSGLATGIDAECHRAALASGGKTVGILGCGIDVDYPKQNRALKTEISGNGAVITEYPLGYQPLPENFPKRNRLISGMCHGTLVVEADLRSGSLITARLAREQGKDVFAVPGSIFQQGVQGTHLLMKEGARLVDCAEDVFAVYPRYASRPALSSAPDHAEIPLIKTSTLPPERFQHPRPLPEGVGEVAAEVYAAFGRETLTVDDLVAITGMKAGEILSALTELEIYGVIQSYPGRRFGSLKTTQN